MYDRRNRVSLYFRLYGKQTARNADGSVGKGKWRKRMPFCNEMDRICNINSCENEQTSNPSCGLANEVKLRNAAAAWNMKQA
ncbi:hypothetical protein [Wolbachia endosymbiont (group A) of Beris morrisii]|uniref:hypothetical protein n=1 Tax=Wolbachia endosymbiont (group A) of Beris morrisii TaxID=3066139 RepID=UPI003341B0DF